MTLSAARLKFLLQVQPFADVEKPAGEEGSLARDLHVTRRLIEPEGTQVAACYVQAHRLLASIPGEVFRRQEEALRHALAPEGGGDHEPFDVGFRGDGRVSGEGQQRRRPNGAQNAEVARECPPQTAGEDVLPGGFGPDPDAAGDL